MKIGIIGGGIAGAATARLLSGKGHEITVFERHETLRPIGSGVMMQPAGVKILERIGLRYLIDEYADPIHFFKGDLDTGDNVINFKFGKLYKGACGYGVHRGLLFYSLIKSLDELTDVKVILNQQIEEVSQDGKCVEVKSSGESYSNYDLMIVASGSRSVLRNDYRVTKINNQQEIGALWATIPYEEGELDKNVLQQYYGKQVLSGLMPIGKNPLSHKKEEKIVNFFWGVNTKGNPFEAGMDFDKFKEQCYKVYTNTPSIIDKLQSAEDLTYAPYYDVHMSKYNVGRVVFMGDVAHAMSPQLSAGTNMALMDAFELSNCLDNIPDLHKALKNYSDERTKQVHYYQWVSRIVTPIFQGEKEYPFLRDVMMQKAIDFPLTKNLVLSTLLGVRKSLFSKLDKSYYI